MRNGYKEEREKTNSLQKQLEESTKEQEELNKTLSEKEALCLKATEEVSSLKDALSKVEVQVKINPEMEQQLIAINKENEHLKRQVEVLREKLVNKKRIIADTESTLNEQIDSLNKELVKEKQKMEGLEKKQEELKSRVIVPSTQEASTSEEQAYACNNLVVSWRAKSRSSKKPMPRLKRN